MMAIQNTLDALKQYLDGIGGAEFDANIACVEELASINTIDGCVTDFEHQLKRKLTDEELTFIKERLKEIEAFNTEYINLQSNDAEAELAAELEQTTEEVA